VANKRETLIFFYKRKTALWDGTQCRAMLRIISTKKPSIKRDYKRKEFQNLQRHYLMALPGLA